MLKDLQALLKQRRKELKYTRAEVTDTLGDELKIEGGLSEDYYRWIEKERTSLPELKILKIIAEKLEIPWHVVIETLEIESS